MDRGFELVPIALGTGLDTLRRFVDHNKVRAPVLYESRSDSTAIYMKYRVGTGYFYLVGPDKRIVYRGQFNWSVISKALRDLGIS